MADTLQHLFSEHGLRCTKQRRAIYKALCGHCGHPTADELYQAVKSRVEGISLATVYNTLEALCCAGLAYKLSGCGGNGSTRYDAAGEDHLHLRCRKTGQVADAPDDLGRRILEHIPSELIDELQHRTGFTVSKIQLDLVGEFKPRKHDREPVA
ncbi:MAG: transcriptional repressor [Gammaproteobacteria bacterium]|nr:MAG: transcriptional repressor [Gammaproteobacteria bacterium]